MRLREKLKIVVRIRDPLKFKNLKVTIFYWVNQIRTDIIHHQKMTFFQIKLQLINGYLLLMQQENGKQIQF